MLIVVLRNFVASFELFAVGSSMRTALGLAIVLAHGAQVIVIILLSISAKLPASLPDAFSRRRATGDSRSCLSVLNETLFNLLIRPNFLRN